MKKNSAENPVSLWNMGKIESISEFYTRKFGWMPDTIREGIGHINVFKLKPPPPGMEYVIPYKRRDFYKITLVIGSSKVHFADQVVEVKKQALTFSNPQIPYKWEHLERIKDGYYCIFNQPFFHQLGNLLQYDVFQPGGTHLFELSDDQVAYLFPVFQRMEQELASDYTYKYDVLRTEVSGLLHFAMKLQPNISAVRQPMNAAQRIATLFLELLERQFPIDENHPSLSLRSASDFAAQLNVHVNHLNKAVKETTDKTTTQVIADRIAQEAKILLKHSPWSVSEIAFTLGFKELTHFNTFFKKQVGVSPLAFRKNRKH
jgi:AraC family transcriptional regulator, transcriptional activator of pobA